MKFWKNSGLENGNNFHNLEKRPNEYNILQGDSATKYMLYKWVNCNIAQTRNSFKWYI